MKLNGAQIFVESLKREGVKVIFGLPGGVVLKIFDVLYDYQDPMTVLTRHEQGAIHMAEGYAKATGRPGVVLVTSGFGLAQRRREVEHAAGVVPREGVHVQRSRHAPGHLAGVAQDGEAAHDDVVRLAADVPGAGEEEAQILPPHAAAGSSANDHGVFWKRASPQSPGSSSDRATCSTVPPRIRRQRVT